MYVSYYAFHIVHSQWWKITSLTDLHWTHTPGPTLDQHWARPAKKFIMKWIYFRPMSLHVNFRINLLVNYRKILVNYRKFLVQWNLYWSVTDSLAVFHKFANGWLSAIVRCSGRRHSIDSVSDISQHTTTL